MLKRFLLSLWLISCLCLPSLSFADSQTKLEVITTYKGSLLYPRDLSLDSTGNVLIADTENYRMVKLSPDFQYLGTFVSGYRIWGIASSNSGNTYITLRPWPQGQHRLIKLNPNYSYNSQYSQLYNPAKVNVDADGNIYIADQSNNRVVKLNSNLAYIAQYAMPDCYVVKVHGGYLYAASYGGLIKKLTLSLSETGLSTTVGPNVNDLAVNSAGDIYIGSNFEIRKLNNAFQKIAVFSISPWSGSVTGIDIDSQDYIYVSNLYDGVAKLREVPVAENWPFETGGRIRSSPAVADLDGNGELEILVGSNDTFLYCINKSGALIWKFDAGGYISSSPAVADLNDDGNLEILVASPSGKLHCVDSNGKVKWAYGTDSGFSSSPAIADIDKDDMLEVIIGSEDGYLHCLDKNGILKWKYQCEGDIINSSPAIADLDGDEKPEILIGLWSGPFFNPNGYLYCIGNAGELKWRYGTNDFINSSPVVADLNRDGNPEILVGSQDKNLYCLDNNGQLLWKYTTSYKIDSTAAVADLDADGFPEVIISSLDKKIYCLNKSGQLVWTYQANGAFLTSSAAVADLDNDGNLEIVIGSQDDNLYCLNKDGERIWQYATGEDIYSSPAVADLNGDGSLEVLFGSYDGKLYCLNKEGQIFVPALPPGQIEPMPWPMFHHDLQRTGLYNRSPVIHNVSVSSQPGFSGERKRFQADFYDPDNKQEELSCLWDFGDGNIVRTNGALSWIKHQYKQPGKYTFTLTVQDPKNKTAKYSLEVDVLNQTPKIRSLGYYPRPGRAGDWVRFSAWVSDPDSEGQNLNYRWDFGDGTIINVKDDKFGGAIHKYKSPGAYTAKVTVTDIDGASSQKAITVIVLKK